jgi:Xaa-Pro aminopeptidase
MNGIDQRGTFTQAVDMRPRPTSATSERLTDDELRQQARRLNAGFSLEERDRRWRVVRRNMRLNDLDCLVVPRAVGGVNLCLSLEQVRGAWSDARYLTMLEDVAVVFFADAREPKVISSTMKSNAWVGETLTTAEVGSAPTWPLLIDVIKQEGLQGARIGVPGLARGIYTHTRAFDGVLSHTSFARLRRAFPDAAFVDATDVLGLCRSQKGPEEIAAIETGALIAERAIETIQARGHVGMDEARLYSIVMERFLELGSEYYSLGFRTGPIGVRYQRVVEPRRGQVVGPNTYFQMEFDALVGGLISQEAQPMVFGKAPPLWDRMIGLHEIIWNEGLDLIKPGAFLGDVIDYCRGFAKRYGLNSSDILMHGRGYGNDGPLITPSDPPTPKMRAMQFEPGNVFVWKPTVGMDEPGRRGNDAANRFSWGGNVLVTEQGTVRLFRRQHGLLSVK